MMNEAGSMGSDVQVSIIRKLAAECEGLRMRTRSPTDIT
jgi:hypothetical protein